MDVLIGLIMLALGAGGSSGGSDDGNVLASPYEVITSGSNIITIGSPPDPGVTQLGDSLMFEFHCEQYARCTTQAAPVQQAAEVPLPAAGCLLLGGLGGLALLKRRKN